MLPNVQFFERGLYRDEAHLRIKNPSCGMELAFQVEACDKHTSEFAGISLDVLMNEIKFPFIDLLKIDIESAELELLDRGRSEWINLVNMVVMELHDFIKPGCS